MKKNINIFKWLLMLTLCSCEGVDYSDDGKADQLNPGDEAKPVVSSNKGQSDVQVNKEITLLTPLNQENVLSIAAESSGLTVWEEADFQTALCDLAGGSQFIIQQKSGAWLKIRLDRMAEKDPLNCPGDITTAFVKQEDYVVAKVGASPERTPRRLEYDIKVFASNELHGDAVCMIAKGNSVLVKEGSDGIHSLQMPKSEHCDENVDYGWFRYVPGLWRNSQ